MKKIISMLTAVCMLVCGFCMNASAETEVYAADPGLSTMGLYTDRFYTGLAKTGSSITFYCYVKGTSLTTDIWVFLYLQEYQSDGTWKSVDGGLKIINGNYVNYSDTYTKAVSGKKYRTRATVHAYSGTSVEKSTQYSTTTLIF